MKKILLSILSIFIISSLTGCSNKTALDIETFKSALESHDYNVISSGEVNYENLNAAALASKDNLQISFMIFDRTISAKNYYLETKDDFIKKVTNNVKKKEVDENNYSKFYIYNNELYKVISRVSETIIIIEGNIDQKNEIETILEDVNY